jgi:hypothetical protein
MRRRPEPATKKRAEPAPPAAARTGARSRTSWPAAACAASLLAVRLASAALNSVHDCDEVFNYWEPLHNLLHGFGLQTWENRRVSSGVRPRGAAELCRAARSLLCARTCTSCCTPSSPRRRRWRSARTAASGSSSTRCALCSARPAPLPRRLCAAPSQAPAGAGWACCCGRRCSSAAACSRAAPRSCPARSPWSPSQPGLR